MNQVLNNFETHEPYIKEFRNTELNVEQFKTKLKFKKKIAKLFKKN